VLSWGVPENKAEAKEEGKGVVPPKRTIATFYISLFIWPINDSKIWGGMGD
jgi:hypothetical protein